MTPRPLSPAERDAIASRYGVAVERIPEAVAVIPRGVSGLDETGSLGCWRSRAPAQVARGRKAAAFAALKRREEAAEKPKPVRVVDPSTAAEKLARKRERDREAKRRAAERRKAERPARVVPPWEPSFVQRRWLELVAGGMSHEPAAAALGMSPRTGARWSQELRERGVAVPVKHSASGPGPVTEKDMAWLRAVQAGATYKGAAKAVGYTVGAVTRVKLRLAHHGHTVPPSSYVPPAPTSESLARARRFAVERNKRLRARKASA